MIFGLFMTIFALSCATVAVVSFRRYLELVERLQEIDEALQGSILVLEAQHDKIEKKTQIELFSDDPIIRELVKDMMTAKESVSAVAKLLDSVTEEEDEETPQAEEKEETK